MAHITLSIRHLSARTHTLLQDCASGLSNTYDVTQANGVLAFTLPNDPTPHLPADLADCVKAAARAGAGMILFDTGVDPTDGLKIYPERT